MRRGVTITATTERGWRVYAITPTSTPPRGTVVYLHGGSWIHQAVKEHWSWVQQLADEASTTVLMPVYPLVQQGGTAARVVPVVAKLCEQAPGPVVLMGDSAGGAIAASASLLLREREVPVALTALIAPSLDLSMSNPEIDLVQPQDPWLVKRGLLEVAELWAGADVDDPILNPIHGDLHGLSPLMIFSGTRDILNPDARLFADRAADAGVDVSYRELPGQLHVYPLLPIPEGRRARTEMVAAVLRAVTGRRPFAET
ncbi:alpha/beta hydrolase fold domain-containing protein [Microlunatus sp. GCM10028923]|uniref:alpha/beta hydrolase fold domain-containing protein n=1 Tax=Microlunatus sp. GCM10028923 TaxID=3273400 RepID=UPI0036092489